MEKLISIIVPIYNVEDYLERCINSIINQTYKELEIILIDDGSTDKCGQICDNYKEKDKRIVVIHKENGGLSSARNIGLDISNGYLISFIDSDDYIEDNMIEKLKKNMEKYESDISICGYNRIKNNKKYNDFCNDEIKEFVSDGKNKFLNLHNEYKSLGNYVWNKLYKKEIFNNIRYPKGKIFEDSYVICEVFNNAKKISYDLTPLYNYVYRKNSIVNSFNNNFFNNIDSSNKKIDFFNKKGYYDLSLKEKNNKTNCLIKYLSKMKRYKIKNKEVFNKYYKELLNTNKEVKWNDANKIGKLFKIFRKSSISALSVMYRVRDLVRR